MVVALLFVVGGVLALLLVAWGLLALWYRSKVKETEHHIPLAPVSADAGFPVENTDEWLHTGLAGIFRTFERMRPEAAIRGRPDERKLEDNAKNKLPEGERNRHDHAVLMTFPDPLSDVVRSKAIAPKLLYGTILARVPVPWRKQYESTLIRVAIKSKGEQQWFANVSRRVSREWETSEGDAERDLAALARAVGFMILKVWGSPFSGRNWRSVRRLADGLDALDRYKQEPKDAHFKEAQECFADAVQKAPKNVEALYFFGVTTMIDRTEEAIRTAENRFEQAKGLLKSPQSYYERKLKALVHAGLAFCHAQRWHRLGERKPEVLEAANKEAKTAQEEWDRALEGPDAELSPRHLMILHARLMALSVDEGTAKTRAKDRERYLEAAKLASQALEYDPNSAMLNNHLGWLFLKLAEWGDERVSAPDVPEELHGFPSETAERYLNRAASSGVGASRLTYANLCLLCATPRFRLGPEYQKYRKRCIGQGKKALKLKPNYVNGHRDLAFGLLRYALHRGNLDTVSAEDEKEAFRYYRRALSLSEQEFPDKFLEKQEEIIKDADTVLKELEAENIQISDELRGRWMDPHPSEASEPRTHADATPARDPTSPIVFVSYNHDDSEVADKLKAALEARGIAVRIDHEAMKAGKDIKDFIEKSIRETDATVSIVSNRSLLSPWVAMETINSFYREKLEGDKKFIACYIDDDFFSKNFVLSSVEKIDARIGEIDKMIPRYMEKKLDTVDLNNEKTRMYELRNNLGKIVQRLRDSLSLDLRETAFDGSVAKVVSTILE